MFDVLQLYIRFGVRLQAFLKVLVKICKDPFCGLKISGSLRLGWVFQWLFTATKGLVPWAWELSSFGHEAACVKGTMEDGHIFTMKAVKIMSLGPNWKIMFFSNMYIVWRRWPKTYNPYVSCLFELWLVSAYFRVLFLGVYRGAMEENGRHAQFLPVGH